MALVAAQVFREQVFSFGPRSSPNPTHEAQLTRDRDNTQQSARLDASHRPSRDSRLRLATAAATPPAAPHADSCDSHSPIADAHAPRSLTGSPIAHAATLPRARRRRPCAPRPTADAGRRGVAHAVGSAALLSSRRSDLSRGADLPQPGARRPPAAEKSEHPSSDSSPLHLRA
jgi:hypothetical protein